MEKPLLEACVDSYESCRAAYLGGADRFELCGQLSIGGVTPSPALFEQVKRDFSVKINVLIRPRGGDFLYSDKEIEQICEEIRLFRKLGADGAVIGALNADGSLDEKSMQRFIELAEGMHVTLHRAFDKTFDAFEALETAVSLGVNTILTSGQMPSAPDGAPLLKELHERAQGRLSIMAGGGVRADNIRSLHEKTSICVFHTSCRKRVQSGMKFLRGEVSTGLATFPEDELFITDEAELRRCAEVVHSL